jgi:hypothetical protein
MMKKKWCLILFHYIPLIFCLSYTPLFYLRFIFFPPYCTNVWDYTIIYCGGACYSYFNQFIGTFDWICNYGVPTVVISFANLFLFCRIIWQKMNRQIPIQWNRQKRMIIQLSFISILYLIFMFPQVIVGSVQTLWTPEFLSDIQANYFYYIVYFINQFLPFIIVGSLPEMHKDLKRWFGYMKRCFHRRVQIHPDSTTAAANGIISQMELAVR